MNLIPRTIATLVRQCLDEAPAVALLGPRQVGGGVTAISLLELISRVRHRGGT